MEPISALLPFINLLRPTKSPHLLIFLTGIICIELFARVGAPDLAQWLFHLPVYAILTIALILSFYYRPPEISGLYQDPTDDTSLEDAQPKDVAIEVDHQFKFARAFCLVGGIVSLYLFATQFNSDIFLYTMITYAIILFHLAVFLFYMAFRTLKEEGMERFSIYQIGFISGIVLMALSVSYGNIASSASVVIISEDGGIEPASVDLWARNNWIFYSAVWFVYVLFWVGRLRHFIKINIVDPAR